ncbi:CatB-related O-acetyltransferase [Sphingobacterium faecium]|uniref:CatB-related O-acetyltransferase n=1 Tax=Sphingobacterium faecium TaxID=34087 RepID=UPI001D16FEE7|nr:CatB-related O-acetyltransferase [Sphingobacterium faecium]
MKNIEIGNYTYGPINVLRWNTLDEGLKIGNFCSIASGVKFILGGNHSIGGISTFPIKFKILGGIKDTLSKGPIVLEDDVWIGSDVIILSGITIGKGCIIAAGSVVTKTFEPYCIVGGNPARIIKKRFDDELISSLNKIDMGVWNEEYIKKNASVLTSCEINREMLDILK